MVFGLNQQREMTTLSRRSLVFLAVGSRLACPGSRTFEPCRWPASWVAPIDKLSLPLTVLLLRCGCASL